MPDLFSPPNRKHGMYILYVCQCALEINDRKPKDFGDPAGNWQPPWPVMHLKAKIFTQCETLTNRNKLFDDTNTKELPVSHTMEILTTFVVLNQ